MFDFSAFWLAVQVLVTTSLETFLVSLRQLLSGLFGS